MGPEPITMSSTEKGLKGMGFEGSDESKISGRTCRDVPQNFIRFEYL